MWEHVCPCPCKSACFRSGLDGFHRVVVQRRRVQTGEVMEGKKLGRGFAIDVSERYFEPVIEPAVPTDPPHQTPVEHRGGVAALSGRPRANLRLRRLSDVRARGVRWLVPGLIPLRAL